VPLNNTAKKLILLTGMLVLMTAKIWIATRLIHQWKVQALADGRPFGDAEDRIS
jgi:hypothetical protein